MMINIASLIIGAIFGFIIGIALIKETSNNLVHEYKEENLRLQYDIKALESHNDQLKNIIELFDDENLEIYHKSDYIMFCQKNNKELLDINTEVNLDSVK